jgi:RHS repeat-associated protein
MSLKLLSAHRHKSGHHRPRVFSRRIEAIAIGAVVLTAFVLPPITTAGAATVMNRQARDFRVSDAPPSQLQNPADQGPSTPATPGKVAAPRAPAPAGKKHPALPAAVAASWQASLHQAPGSPAIAPPSSPSNYGYYLQGVTCVGATDCWAVGFYSSGSSGHDQTLIEQYTGTSWQEVYAPNPGIDNRLSAITCISATNCWAVGQYFNGTNTWPITMQYTGTGWVVIPSNGPTSGVLGAVTCLSSANCWAVGHYYDTFLDYLTLVEQWNGTQWAVVSSPSPGIDDILYSVACVTANNCWAAGTKNYVNNGSSGGNLTLVEQWNGTQWAVVSSPSPTTTSPSGFTGDSLLGLTCVSGSNCWAVGYQAAGFESLVEQWDGTQWTVVSSPSPGTGTFGDNTLSGINCVGASDCWAVGTCIGGTTCSLGLAGSVLIEQYDGTTWNLISGSNVTGSGHYNQLYSDTCVSATDCWAVGRIDGATDATLIEQYNGSAWTISSTATFNGQLAPIGGPVVPNELLGGTNCACANASLGQSYSGDPVDTAYGNFTEISTDLTVPGRGILLQFSRTYNSMAAANIGPLGYGWTSNYLMTLSQPGGSGPVTITQEGGAQVVFNQNGSTYAPAAPRVVATLTHNGDGTWTFMRLAGNTYTFSATGQLTSEKDRNGYVTSLAYNGSNQLATVTDPASRTLSIGWTGSNITSVADPNVSPSRNVTFGYNDGNGNLTDVTDVNGGHAHFIYDPSHRITNLFDPNCYAAGALCNGGNGVVNGYDSQGRVSSQQDQLGRNTTWGYAGDPTSSSGGTTTITDPKNNVTVDSYQYGLLTQKTRGFGTPAAATWQYAYDPTTAAFVSEIDPNGNVANFSVDSNGNQLSRTDALGRFVQSSYNAFNEPLTQTDPLNVTTTFVYDGNGNLTSESSPLLDSTGHVIATETVQNLYGDSTHPGDVTSMIDPANHTWIYGYDSYGDQTSTTDPLANKATTTFNADGWTLTTVAPRGNVSGCNCAAQYTTTYGYLDTISGRTNAFGDVASVTDALGHVTANHYDADRNLTSTNDGNGNPTTYVFDLANEKTDTRRTDGSDLHTDYFPDGTVQDQKDGKSSAIATYSYDTLARVISRTDAIGNATLFTYDGNGNELTQQDPGGSCNTNTGCTTMTYDVGNELTGIFFSDGVTPNVSSIIYDSDGQRLAMTDGTGSSQWAWDSLHRLTSFTDGRGDQVQHQYDLRGLVTQISYPGNLLVTRGYDNAGRWTSVQDWRGNTTNFGYDPDGNLTTKTLPLGTAIVDSAAFNAAEQLTSLSDVKGVSTTLFAATYGRDNNGQVSTDSSLPPSVGSDRYTNLNQLCYAGSSNSSACAAPPSGSQAYSYDVADNLTGNKGAAQTFNAADQLCWTIAGTSSNPCSSAPTGATSYSYDTRGNRTMVTPASGTVTNLGYDQANHLTSWSQGSTTATYAYNGDGLRMSKTVSGVTNPMTWDVGGLPLLISDATFDYVYGPAGLPLEQVALPPPISLVGTATATGKSTSLRVTFPAGVQVNDQVVVASTEPSTTTVTAPSGYNLVTSVTSGGSSPLATTKVFSHTVVSGETSVTLTYGTSTTAQAAVLGIYRGVDPNLPIDVAATSSAAATTTVTAPSVTPTYTSDQLLVFQGAAGTFSGSSWTAPTGTVERAQVNTTANVSTGLADQAIGAGATGTRTSTFGRSANLTSVVVAVSQPPSLLFVHSDQLGSTRMLTDGAGVIRGTFTYDPYGNVAASTGSSTSRLGYSGQYRDAETGFLYLRARYYDPTTCQFLSQDPAVVVSRQPYAYAGGQPTNSTDPTGLDSYLFTFMVYQPPQGYGTPSPAALMSEIQNHPNQAFPAGLAGCPTVTYKDIGEKCDAGAVLGQHCAPVQLAAATQTSFTLVALNNHCEHVAGSTITFSVCQQGSNLYFQVAATYENNNPVIGALKTFFSWATWEVMSGNVSSLAYGLARPPPRGSNPAPPSFD